MVHLKRMCTRACLGLRDCPANAIGSFLRVALLLLLQVPGNIRRAEHFLAFLRRFIEYLRQRLNVQVVETETPATFLANLQEKVAIEGMHLSVQQPQVRLQQSTLSKTAVAQPEPTALLRPPVLEKSSQAAQCTCSGTISNVRQQVIRFADAGRL